MLGVTSHADWTDAVARSERAATMILHPPHSRPATLVEDGMTFSAATERGLAVELAGALCRMIVDHSCELEVRAPTGSVRFRVDAVGNLAADGLDGPRAWPDPVTVLEPARLAAAALVERYGMTAPRDLDLELRVWTGTPSR